MILLQVNLPRVTLIPFERDTPRTIQVKAITLRLSPKGMEIEARPVELSEIRRGVERVETHQDPRAQIRGDLRRCPGLEQLTQGAASEALDHTLNM